ncbi:Histone-lysine N-methyltransferase ATXR3 [Camellia lanceoleosa]|uniref:Histone-lysine N-methyltransferase ATXR3 n=1 Tax=Camellia lanceoleosa TaxID=1840588 RepID=A0ACC0HGW4_9ERIC|nr:Histone-lysine N-methyltransferase ATXR3 [Camellia lanceoleosa]
MREFVLCLNKALPATLFPIQRDNSVIFSANPTDNFPSQCPSNNDISLVIPHCPLSSLILSLLFCDVNDGWFAVVIDDESVKVKDSNMKATTKVSTEVKRKMWVSLPVDYTEKLCAQRNGTEESDMEIPEFKDYKPGKQL